jgi:gas vesicle protein
MMWLAWLAGAAIGVVIGYLRGVQVCGATALELRQAVRSAARALSVFSRRAQEARARYIAGHVAEWDETHTQQLRERDTRGDGQTCE